MKLPSINYLLNTSKNSFFRFPLTIISALFSVCLFIYLLENKFEAHLNITNLLLTSTLGIPLFFCISMLANKASTKIKLVYFSIGFIFLTLIYFSFPFSDSTNNTSLPYIRYIIFNIIVHLLVSFSPYIKSKSLNGFWNYNKILFLRFCSSVLFSGVLYIGITLALLSITLLFDFDIDEDIYGKIWIIIAGLFNTWFFVSGIPEDIEQLDNLQTYPKGLKIFTQYILLPLLFTYLLILYLYGGKIILLWDWPKGVVSWLISIVATLGILTFLLIYPYGNNKENSWIKKLTLTYYYSLIPLLFLMFAAIWMRVTEYGITINRYIIILLAVWLTVVCIYFIVKKSNIKFIPTSLAIILTLVSFGPWGIFSLSETSQIKRLKNILESNSLLENGKIINEVEFDLNDLKKDEFPNNHLLNDSLKSEVKSILNYLDDFHDFNKIKPFFSQNIDSLINVKNENKEGEFEYNTINESNAYMLAMGLEYYFSYSSKEISTEYFYFKSASNKTPINIANYNLFYEFYFTNYDDDDYISFNLNNINYSLSIDNNNSKFTISSNSSSTTINLTKKAKDLINTYSENKFDIPLTKMTLIENSELYEYKLVLKEFNLSKKKDEIEIEKLSGYLLIKNK